MLPTIQTELGATPFPLLERFSAQWRTEPLSLNWTFQAESAELRSNYGCPIIFRPDGARRRSSSKKLIRKLRCVAGFCPSASAFLRIGDVPGPGRG